MRSPSQRCKPRWPWWRPGCAPPCVPLCAAAAAPGGAAERGGWTRCPAPPGRSGAGGCCPRTSGREPPRFWPAPFSPPWSCRGRGWGAPASHRPPWYGNRTIMSGFCRNSSISWSISVAETYRSLTSSAMPFMMICSKPSGNIGVQGGGQRRAAVDMLDGHRHGGFPVVGRAAGHHFVHDNGQRIDIGTVVSVAALGLLRGDVVDASQALPSSGCYSCS